MTRNTSIALSSIHGSQKIVPSTRRAVGEGSKTSRLQVLASAFLAYISRGLSPGTIASHLVELCREGRQSNSSLKANPK